MSLTEEHRPPPLVIPSGEAVVYRVKTPLAVGRLVNLIDLFSAIRDQLVQKLAAETVLHLPATHGGFQRFVLHSARLAVWSENRIRVLLSWCAEGPSGFADATFELELFLRPSEHVAEPENDTWDFPPSVLFDTYITERCVLAGEQSLFDAVASYLDSIGGVVSAAPESPSSMQKQCVAAFERAEFDVHALSENCLMMGVSLADARDAVALVIPAPPTSPVYATHSLRELDPNDASR